ncbi:MAG: transporter substrate-binding domain-containing protein [Arcobacter sp.]|nr:transporter substrate-binding domain-containing protein [Arcobacter sp.]
MKKIIIYLLILPIFLVADFKQKLTSEEKKWLENKEFIIVGAMDNWAPINFVNYNKEASGIGSSLIELLNKKLDNKLKIESSNWNNIYEKAKNAKIDLILDITPKKDREEFFFFSKPYLEIPHVIVSKSEQKSFKSLEDLKGKIVALEEGVGTVNDLKNNHPQIVIKTFENTTLALDAVSRGLADAYIGNRAVVTYKLSTELINNLKIDSIDTTRIASLLTIGVPKNYPILYSIIQKAIDEITPQEFNKIYKKWSNEDWIELKLTNQEKEWLKNNPIIKFAADPNYMPYESFDSTGNYVGFISTYLTSLEETLGIKFDIIKTDSWQETLEYARTNKIDMFTNYMEAEEFEKTHITKPLDIKSPIVVVGKKDINKEFIISIEQLKNKKIAVIKDYFYLNEIYKQFPNFNYIEVENASIALNGVSLGLYDVALCSLPVATYNISQLGLSNLEIVGKTDTFMQLGFSIKKIMKFFHES